MLKYKPVIYRDFYKKILTRKNPEEMIKKASEAGLQKTLSAVDLVILGIGAIIGSGIFAVVGIAAAGGNGSAGAGPALVISMLIATVACIFSALCYSEFATMIPVAGGAYTYAFATLGEFAAWMVGWVLMLEYVVGYIAVACAWSNHFMQFVKGFENYLPAWVVNPPVWLIGDYKSVADTLVSTGHSAASIPTLCGIPFCINLPAIAIVAVITAILIKGTKDSTKMTTLMVIIKLSVIALFVICGAFYVKPENWTPFAPNGLSGIFMGAFVIFFAYIGFDALATTAEECKNPQKDLPVGIIGSLFATTIVYISVALVLTGMYCTSGPIDAGFLKAPMAFVMELAGMDGAAGLISIGSLAGLTSVLIVLQLASTRILYAMSRDNFLPKVLQKLHPVFKTPHILTVLVGVVCIVGTITLDLNKAAQLCNFGTFTSFIIICVAVLILRKTDPERPRPFRVPCSPLFPILGIVCCGGLMLCSLKTLKTSASLFLIWLTIGVIIYMMYGYVKNRNAEICYSEREIRITKEDDKECVTK
ncbi:MAG: amino acid permease [Candidatus Gastranaerophilales bacterium]|nr:amino acid permease [Candidatus Gastranaerophilales bacterium]